MSLKTVALVALGLACASCAGGTDLQPLSSTRQPTQQGHVNKITARITTGPLAGHLMVANYYHQPKPQSVTSDIVGDMDARAQLAGCPGGALPRRDRIERNWSSSSNAYRLLAWYSCR